MSGKRISCVLRYGVNADSSFHATRSLVWPMLRTVPNNTHASLTRRFAMDGFNLVTVNCKPLLDEKVFSISLNGTLIVKSKTDNDLELTRQFFPSTSLPGYVEIYTIKNNEGVVMSNSDELEGRFPSGNANLSTSSLYYDALNSAVYLGESLGKSKKEIKSYMSQASALKKAIEKYFGARIDGFNTYKYYKENDTLRAWICVPLTMGIYKRKEGTIDALFSPGLWTNDGLASLSGDKTFWDRATLYALRGVLAAGETDKALKFLQYYSNRRLLGEHVPYPVEAYPEGNQRHLSAESGLYCRIYTEGLFGIRPTGLQSFSFSPRLPALWNEMSLKHIRAFTRDFDIEVSRTGEKIKVIVSEGGNKIVEKLVDKDNTILVEF